ncbi:MAG TPA: biotin--[acetyl-CoA-carboxylase] ligase [Chromatiales bacterium]|nr:biotin--[acetyl-CoA-carboxylase] ligase [Thiotrichales bacterium]HIP68652.1 biotin--[acetyl-CoA-carboxylase] ligase [Chromatiales bacterium]
MGLKNSILFTLSDGKPHDRVGICDRWGISEGELDAAVLEMRKDGLMLTNVGRGNLCWENPSEPLDEAQIKAHLSPACKRLIPSFDLHYSLPSTNQYLCENASLSGEVCLAEKQTQGKGRNGRRWFSPPGQNIYLSIHWQFAELPQHAGLLSLAVGIAAARALHALGYKDVGLKWPNDLVLRGKKLGGILVDVSSRPGQGMHLVAGIGLNVAMQISEEIDQPWISLFAVNPTAAKTRNVCVAKILNEVFNMLNQFAENGPTYVQTYWPDFDLAAGQEVMIITDGGEATGLGAGIDHQGRFKLQTKKGLIIFHQAEVSLRLQ